MNENYMNENKICNIIEYSIRANGDKTYRMSIKTDVSTIEYDRARIVFGFNQAQSISFPFAIQVLNNSDEVVMNYSLNIPQFDIDKHTDVADVQDEPQE